MNTQVSGMEILVGMLAICLACFVLGYFTGKFVNDKFSDEEDIWMRERKNNEQFFD